MLMILNGFEKTLYDRINGDQKSCNLFRHMEFPLKAGHI